MKILFLGFAVSNHTRRWCNVLAERGHDVLLLCQPDKKDDADSFRNDVKIHYLKYGGKLGYYFNVAEVRHLYKSFNPDVVNAHFATGYGTTARLANLRPRIVSCWGSDVYEFPYKSKLNKYVVCRNLNSADAIASTSKAMAEQARLVLGKPNQEITVTPFGVDLSKFVVKENKQRNQRPIIGIVKYLKPIYDIELLLQAFAIIYNARETKPLLHIYGDGPLRDDLKKLAFELGIADSVEFFGTVPNTTIPDVLSSFDVFVNCSKQESFGVAVVEAMACGVPVVVTDTPGYREIVDNDISGIVLKDRTPQTMANAINQLLDNKELANRYKEAGLKKVNEEYDWKKNVDTMIALYERIKR